MSSSSLTLQNRYHPGKSPTWEVMLMLKSCKTSQARLGTNIPQGVLRQKASRNTTIIRFSRLGWSQEKIAEVVGLSRNRASEIVGNTNFSEIDTLLSHGRDMDYIARHYNMDIPLARPPRLRQCRWGAGLGITAGRKNWSHPNASMQGSYRRCKRKKSSA